MRGIAPRLFGATVRGTRYDAILGAIPAAFLLAAGVATLTGISLEEALLGAAAVGALTLVDALYRNPPTTGRA